MIIGSLSSLKKRVRVNTNHVRTAFMLGMALLFTLLNLRPLLPRFPFTTKAPQKQKQNQKQKPAIIYTQTRSIVPLEVLTNSFDTAAVTTCPDDGHGHGIRMQPVRDRLVDAKLAFRNRLIPRIVHLTGKSRCVHPKLAENVELWKQKLPDHSVFFHDDSALDQLLYRDWPEFPHLKYVLNCVLYGGAVKADIWRLLVLWEYGGIYADFDSRPNRFNTTTITPDDQVFLVMDRVGVPSQWFMSASPRHPFIYCAIQALLRNLMALEDVGHLPVVWTTGPGAVSDGFSLFLREHKGNRMKRQQPDVPGVYRGAYGHTVRIAGTHENEDEFIERNIFEPLQLKNTQKPNRNKHEIYKTMGMAHLTTFGYKNETNRKNESCVWRMWHEEMKDALQWSPSW